MKRVYQAANLPEAYHVVNLLGQSGIAARVLNENAVGGAGELPVNAYPEVWVDDDAAYRQARQLIGEYEQPVARSVDRHCPNCGESSPSTFSMCWKCGAELNG